MMSFTEPVPLGTWQSSVLISVKLLMFQGDVLFFWQGSVLINVTSILHVGILVSSGIPHEIFVHLCFMRRRGTPGHRGAIATSSCIVLGQPSRQSISVCCSFVTGFLTGFSVLLWLFFPALDE